ncbi:MAG: WD40/YVTN/BNR-like repeat-containing protein [Actinomycetota bacterium]
MIRALLRGNTHAAIALPAIVGLLTLGLLHGYDGSDTEPRATAAKCPPGFQPWDQERSVERELNAPDLSDDFERLLAEMDSEMPSSGVCLSNKHPEEFAEIEAMLGQRVSRAAAPFNSVAPGAFQNAVTQTAALEAVSPRVAGAGGTWRPLGRGPLISDDPRYDEVNGLGLSRLAGRIDSLDYDEKRDRLFATIGTGGLWMSEDRGQTWSSIGDTLPTQTNGAVSWSDARGGTLVLVSGEPLMGGNTYTGLGAYWSNDLGGSWHRAKGVPGQALGFQVAVDPTDQSKIYVASSMGLFRSNDAGRSFRNVNLPTGECAGKTGYGRCQFANFVTDVVIQAPGGVTDEDGGVVLAAVGYRAGLAEFPNGEIHSTHNGLFRSRNGARGSFEKLDVSGDGVTPVGFAPQQNIGRVELGEALGEEQDHNYVYAIVEDAELFNGGVPSIDVPDDPGADDQALYNTSFNGIYVSADFGDSWTRMADTAEVAENPTTHSGLAVTGQATLFAPGVQAWYNMWIKPDPTRQTEEGVPTRLTFGLEEVWANRCEGPQNAPEQAPCDAGEAGDFEVIGPYFGNEACLLLDTGTPTCPTAEDGVNPETTTHPDQHDAIYIPGGDGGVSLVVGNDGGAYVQTVGADEPFTAHQWGKGDNDGFHTLLPYDAEVAKDGTVWYGLQDNGSGKITPRKERQLMTFGGDGFFVAVEPNNSDVAYSETPFADMRVTDDGGKTWSGIAPPVTNSMFSNPFVMDPDDPDHIATAGNEVVETLAGEDTRSEGCGDTGDPTGECDWKQVFDLGNADSEGAPPNSMSAIDVDGDAAYVGYCGVCDILNRDPKTEPFMNGLATNVGGNRSPKKGTPRGWHHVSAKGLPNRYITSIAIDPRNRKVVYVSLGGYANREWVPPGSYLDQNSQLGEGHVFKSTNAGKSFEDVSANLPNVSANWVEIHKRQLVVGTDTGAFVSKDLEGSRWAVLGDDLPSAPVVTVRNHPGDRSKIIVATFGRGVYAYRFPN